jgi:GH24 family phage-related lysozyme (muramidase)
MITNGRDFAKDAEGYLENVYLDSEGYPTVGYGWCLDYTRKWNSVKDFLNSKFEEKYHEAELDYEKLGLDLDPVRRDAVIDLIYNMGLTKVLKFKNTLAALKMKDYLGAGNNLEQSLWYKQVGRRGKRIVNLIKTGNWDSLINGK